MQALVDAAMTAFPAWFPAHTIVRYILGTLGSLAVIVLLARSRREHT